MLLALLENLLLQTMATTLNHVMNYANKLNGAASFFLVLQIGINAE
jgi:hypothetical protein